MVQAATKTPIDRTQFGLSDTQIAMYRRDGFLLVRQVFDNAFVTTVRDAFNRMHRKSQTLVETSEIAKSLYVIGPPQADSAFETATLRVVWAGGDEPILETLGSHPRILSMASTVLGSSSLMQLINQAHFKHPYDGVDFPWHQDSRHRRQGTDLFTDLDGCGSFVETLTAIDPMTSDNGPLEVLVGSHKEGHLENFADELPRLLNRYPSQTIQMAPGDVMLCSPFIVHQSLANTGSTSRYVFLNGFALPGASRRIYPGCGLGRLRQISSNTV